MFGIRAKQSLMAKLPDAETLPRRELVAMDSLVTPIEIPAGRVLMHQGAPGSDAMLILEGEVLVDRDGEAVAILGPGSVVGEAALLANQPRNATVTAATDVLAVAMSRREFATILDRCPVMARRILTTAVDRAGARIE